MLSHPNVVDVYDLDVSEGSTFLACELVEGGSLRAWLDESPRTTAEIVGIILDAARGLDAAHRMDLIHRDVSPNNILVGGDGRGRVADFGLARLPTMSSTAEIDLAGGSGESSDGDPGKKTGIVGTPAYVAPEVLAGLGAQAAADQYSLCVTAYEALHGHLPAQRGDHDVGQRKVARAVDRVLARGMQTDPRNRYPTVGSLHRALQAAMRPRSRFGIAAAAATVVALGSFAVAAQDRQTACGGTNPGLELTLAVETSALSPQVGQAVAAYADRWGAVSQRTCNAAEQRALPARALDRRWACLSDRREDILVTATALADHSEGLGAVSIQFRALEGLPVPELCEDDASLERRAPPPPSQIAADVEELKALLRRVRADTYWATPGTEEALARAIEIAGRLGFDPITAKGLMIRGQFERDRNEFDQARQTLETAALLATSAKADYIAAICWLHIISMEGYGKQDFDAAMAVLPLADAAIERLDRPAELMGFRERTLAVVHDTAASYEVAEMHHRAALRWTAESHGDESQSYAEVLANFGAHYSRRLDPERAGRHTEAALELTRRRLGPGTVNEAILLRNLSVNASTRSEATKAAEFANQSLEVIAGHLEADDTRLGPFLSAAGEANVLDGRVAEGIEQLERAVGFNEADLPPSHPLLVDTQRILGEAYLTAGRHDDADDMLGKAMVDLDKNRPHVQAQLLFDRGTVWTALQRYSEAANACARAREIAKAIPADDLSAEAERCHQEAQRLASDSTVL